MTATIIKKMREASGFSQEELAKRLKIDQSTLSGYETGKRKPNLEMIERIADICEFDIIVRDRNSGEIIEIKKR